MDSTLGTGPVSGGLSDPLDAKLTRVFEGKVVRKDLVRKVKRLFQNRKSVAHDLLA